jgi:hypothetical protein
MGSLDNIFGDQQEEKNQGVQTVRKSPLDSIFPIAQKTPEPSRVPARNEAPVIDTRPVLKAAPEPVVKDESWFKKALKTILPRELEVKFGLTDPNVGEVMMQNEDARAVYLRNKKFEETLKKEGVPDDINTNPEKYIPEDYKEPTSFLGNLKEGLVYGYYATIRPAIGYLAESLGQDFGTPDMIKWGQQFGDKQIATLLKKPELLAPADQKGFFEGGAFDSRYYARTIGETAPFVATILGSTAVAALTKNPAVVKGVAFASVAAVEKASSYKQMLDQGIAPDKAATASTIYGGIAAYIENAFGFKPSEIVLGKEGRNLIVSNFKNFMLKELPTYSVNFMKNALAEGAEEGAQQLAQNLITKWFDQSQGVWEGVFESIPAGVAGSLPFGVSEIISDVRKVKIKENYISAEDKIKAGNATEEDLKNFANTKTDLASFEDEAKQIVYEESVPNTNKSSRVEVIQYGDGTWGYAYDVNTSSNGVAKTFSPAQTEPTRESAIDKAKSEIISWASGEIEGAANDIKAELNGVISSIKQISAKQDQSVEPKAQQSEIPQEKGEIGNEKVKQADGVEKTKNGSYRITTYSEAGESQGKSEVRFTKSKKTGKLFVEVSRDGERVMRMSLEQAKKKFDTTNRIEIIQRAVNGKFNKETGRWELRQSNAPVIKNTSQNQIEKKPVKTKGQVKNSRAFQRVQGRLGEYADIDVNYNRLNLADDTAKAIEFVEKYPNDAKKIALGMMGAPEGVTETAISIALAEKAAEDKNYELQAQLERSRSLRQTRRGQEIVAERGRFNENSPHFFMQQVLVARMEKAGKTKFRFFKKRGESVYAGAEAKMREGSDSVKQAVKRKLSAADLAQSVVDKLTCK